MFSSDLLLLYITIVYVPISLQNHYGGLNKAYDQAIKHFNFNKSMADLMVRCIILCQYEFDITTVWLAIYFDL